MADIKIPPSEELDKIHKEFWGKQKELLDKRMKDAALVDVACDTLERIPLENNRVLKSSSPVDFDKALEYAESDRKKFREHQSKKGGEKNKGRRDPLQVVIMGILKENPIFTATEVWRKIHALPDGEQPKNFHGIKKGTFNERVSRAKKESDEAV